MRVGTSLDFLEPHGIEAVTHTIHYRHGQRSPYQRTLFLLLSVVVIFSNSSITPALLHAATSVVTENFTNTANIDVPLTTATVDTTHNQTRLTTTDAWTNVMGFQDGDNIKDIAFAPGSSTTAWLVTNSGTIVRTDDGGVTWPRQSSGTTTPLNAVSFVDSSHGWVAGGTNDNATGIILRTTNGGSTWSAVTPSAAPTLLDIFFINSTTGWAVGTSGKIYSTTDAGSTWSAQSVTGLTGGELAALTLNGISLSSTTGIIVGSSGTIIKSTDTGATWTKRTSAVGIESTILNSPVGQLKGVYLATADIAWMVGAGGSIAKTTNASSAFTLTLQSTQNTGNAGLDAAINEAYPGVTRIITTTFRSIHFANNVTNGSTGTGIAVGDLGTIFKLTSGGSTIASEMSATNHTINSVVMLSTTTAYVVGDIAIVLKTTDGGSGSPTSWSNLTQARLEIFNDIAFADADTGLIVGDESTMLLTTNGSNASPTWKGIPSPAGANNWKSIGVVSPTTFWVTGTVGGLYYTSDAGGTWIGETSGVSTSLNDIHVASGTSPNITAYVVGDGGVIKKTTNGGNSGGATWSTVTSGTSQNLRSVSFSPSTTTLGWAVGESGTLLSTTNGGTTWVSQATNARATNGTTPLTITGYTLYGVKMLNDTTGWIVGSSGLILKTTDAGVTWIQQTSGVSVGLTSVTVVNASTVWVTGDSGGTLLSTTNGGTSWASVTTNTGAILNAVAVPSGTNYWVVGSSVTIIRSTDSGSTFSVFYTDNSPDLQGIDGSGSTVYSSGFGGIVLKSSDAGATWSALSSGITSDLYAMTVVDSTTAWAAGVGGTIVKTTDGSTWFSQSSGTSSTLYGMDAVSSSVAWAVGNNGVILKTTSGTSWSAQASTVSTALYAVSAIDTSNAVAVGGSGVILVTTNGGTTWTSQTANARLADGTTVLNIASRSINGVHMVSSTTGWVVGSGGLILKTTNSGTTWVQQTAPASSILNAIVAPDAQSASIVTEDNKIFHTTDGSTWTSVTGVFAKHGIWMGDFETVVAVGGGGHWAARYTPTYASPKIVVSSNRHSDASLGITRATLTATATVNSQTITYYMTNSETTVPCSASAPWQLATSGSPVTFSGGASTKLFWCAQLSSSSSTVSPRLTQVSISYETVGIRGGGGGHGGCTSDCQPPPPPDCSTINCPPTFGPSSPTAGVSQALSGTSIQWNFTPTSQIASEYILSKKGTDGHFTELIRKVQNIISSIVETTGITPNTEYADRVVQASNSAGTSNPTALPSATTLSLTPSVPQLDAKSTSTAPAIMIFRGDNPDYTDMTVHEKDNAYVLASGSFNRDQVHPEWRSFTKWGQTVLGNDDAINTNVRRVPLSQVLPNREYFFDVRTRNLKGVESTSTQLTRIVSPIEEVKQVIVAEPVVGTVTMDIASIAPSGEFSNLQIGDSAVWIEIASDAVPIRSSGWIREPRWVVEGVTRGIYQVRVKARNQQGIVTPVFVTTAIVSGDTPIHIDVPPAVILNPQNGAHVAQSPVTITGTAMVGSVVELTVDGVVSTLPVSNLGAWQSSALVLLEGAHTVSSVAKAGTATALATRIQFTVGTRPPAELPPAAPRIQWPTEGAIVRSSDFVIGGITPVGTTVDLQVDGRIESIVPDVQGQWSTMEHLVNGSYTVRASSVNANHIPSLMAATVMFVVKETIIPIKPIAPVILEPLNGATIRTQLVNIGGRAPRDTAVVVSVSKEGDTSGSEDSTFVDDGGLWNISKHLTNGLYSIAAYSITQDGATSSQSSITMRVSGSTPDEPIVEAPVVRSPLSGTTISSDSAVFRGSSQPSSIVEVRFAGKDPVRSAFVGTNGLWVATVDLAGVANGRQDAWVQAFQGTTGSGNTIVEGLRINRTSPPLPVVIPPTVTSPVEGSIIRSDTVVFRGTAGPGSIVEVDFAGQDTVRSSVVGTDRLWTATVDLTGAQEDSTQDAWVRVVDTDALTVVHGLTIDRIPAPVVIENPIVIRPVTASTIRTNTVTFTGTAQPGSTVGVDFAGKDQVRSSIIGADRLWTATVDLTGVPDSTHDAWVRAFQDDQQSGNIIVARLRIDRTPAPLSAPVVLSPSADSTIRSNNAVFRGTAEPGSIVEVRFAGIDPVHSTVVGNNRAWTVTVDITGVPDSTHTAYAEASLGQQHSITSVERLTIDRTPAPEPLATPVVTVPTANSTITTDAVTFNGTSENGTIVEVRFAGLSGRSAIVQDLHWSIELDLRTVANGTHDATVQATKGTQNPSADTVVRALKIDRTPASVDILPPPPPPGDHNPPPGVDQHNDTNNSDQGNGDTNGDTTGNTSGQGNTDNSANNGNGTNGGARTNADQANNNGNTGGPDTTEGFLGRVRSFFSGGSDTAQKVISVTQLLSGVRQKSITIAGHVLDANGSNVPTVTISREAPTLELSGQANEPFAAVTVTTYSAPFSAATTADQNGNWRIVMDLSSKEPVVTHTVALKTNDSQGETPEATIGYFHIPSTSAIVNALPQPVAKVVVAGVEGIQKAAVVTARVTKEAAIVTHQAIVKAEPETRSTLAAVLPTIVVVNPSVVATVPQLPFMIYHLFTWVLSFLGIRKKRKSWGVAYDAITKEPIALAIIRLMDETTKRLVETQVTDRSGRFGFLVKEGKYRLEVVKTGFTFPSKIITAATDGDYSPVYHHEDMAITSDAQTVGMAIPMDPVNHKELSKIAGLKGGWNHIAGLVHKVHLPIMIAGVVISVVVAINVPSPTNIAMAALYAMMAGFQYLLTPPEARPWGTVFDALELAPVPLALIDIIDTKYNKLLKSRLTDYNGRFAFLPPKGTYKLNVRKAGYQFPVPDVRPTRKFKNLYRGEEVVIAKDEGIIAKDIPVIAVNQASQVNPVNPAPTTSGSTASPVSMPMQPSPAATAVASLAPQGGSAMSVLHNETLLGKDHESNIHPIL